MKEKKRKEILKDFRHKKMLRTALSSGIAVAGLSGLLLTAQPVAQASGINKGDASVNTTTLKGADSSTTVQSKSSESSQNDLSSAKSSVVSTSTTPAQEDSGVKSDESSTSAEKTTTGDQVDDSSVSNTSTDHSEATTYQDSRAEESSSKSSKDDTENSNSEGSEKEDSSSLTSSAVSSSAVTTTVDSSSTANKDTTKSSTNMSSNNQKSQTTTKQTFKILAKEAVAKVTSFNIGDKKYTSGDAVDVSSYQSWMTQADFNYLKGVGIKTIIVKFTEGNSYLNPYAQSQINMAKRAGLNVSIYHFVRFNTQNGGNSEGQYVANNMKKLGLGTGTLIFADIEEAAKETVDDGIDMKSALQSFWSALNRNGYTNHGVYTGPSYRYFNQIVSTVGRARTWIAQYPYTPTKGGYYEQQWKNAGYGGWQYSSTAQLRGHSLDVSHAYNSLLTNGFAQEGNIEGVEFSSQKIHVKGWHIKADSSHSYGYVIAWDSQNKREVGRVAFTPSDRQDVANKYSGIVNALKSGFDVWVPIRNGYNISNQNIQFLIRYSADKKGDNNYEQMVTKNYSFKNRGNLEGLSLDGKNVLHVRGWHATDDSYRLKNSYLIVYDANRKHEITRVKYTPQVRKDVANSQYAGGITNSLYSGFDLGINLKNYLVAGKNIQIVMRKSLAENDSQYVDVWSSPYKIVNQNKGNLETFELKNNNVLHVRGWHATSSATVLKNSMIIIYDKTNQREITRVDYISQKRQDVARSAYAGSIPNALYSGFDLNINLGNYLINGKDIQVVMRNSAYSGHNDAKFIDVWSAPRKLSNQNKGNLEKMELKSGNTLHVQGWHAADASKTLHQPIIIIYDASSKHEITRVNYSPQVRKDVAKSAYAGKVYNSLNSGINLNVNLKGYQIKGKKIQVVMRYAIDNKDSNFIDVWSTPVVLKK